ncbi:MAG: DUF2249 domain-containing protein [Crocinitomicaceae bacterium]|nr:DUF2249 domain-containing protein [Crocinitomicaceae bacterium]
MLINERTKIAQLLKHHPDALETIITIAPDFKKLRNPILRKLMAGRTTIAMASKIGGCKPEDFFKALAPLGFEVDTVRTVSEDTPENKPMPAYLKSLAANQLVHFDVRAMLASGEDPLKSIQQKVNALNPGQALLIVNNFEPVPLIKLLERQGYSAYVRFVDSETIETYFYKENATSETTMQVDEVADSDDWDEVLSKYDGRLVEIDVRHLEMPMPMMTILGELDVLPEDKALFVNHKKIPVFLLTELKDRGFEYRIKDVQEGEVYLLIFKDK